MERIPIEAGCDYHAYNRGTEKRDIFTSIADYFKFIHYLYIANDSRPFHLKDAESEDFRETDRDPVVEILAFVLMRNHFHISVRPLIDTGMAKFMQKLLTGYTMYFNKKYSRSGALFQGRYKCKALSDAQYLPILVRYIHLNPVASFIDQDGRTKSKDEIRDFLLNYRWSSLPDYVGLKNFPSIISRGPVDELFKTPADHMDFLLENVAPEEIIPQDLAID